MYKHNLSNYWASEKIPFSLPIPIPPLWASYYTCNIIRDVNLWFSKCRWKVNLFCYNQVIIIYWLKKWSKTSCFWSTHYFENVPLLSISRNSLQLPSLDDILSGNFTLSNSIILVEDLIRWKRYFEIFVINHCAGNTGNKIIAGKYQTILVSVSTTLYRRVSSHRVLHL